MQLHGAEQLLQIRTPETAMIALSFVVETSRGCTFLFEATRHVVTTKLQKEKRQYSFFSVFLVFSV